jgi:hypothetical protein
MRASRTPQPLRVAPFGERDAIAFVPYASNFEQAAEEISMPLSFSLSLSLS